ncbi:unnamed protein product [Somion occarium]|uniref:Uncharacterized protein n=1 Tax=Somion occarium TaxID=3059160 RepID=A0ABP1CSG4_9APHY
MTSYTEAGDGNVFTICILSRLIRRRLIMVLRFIYIRLFNVRIFQQSFGILWKPRLSSSDDTKVTLKSTSPCVRNVSCCPDKYVLSDCLLPREVSVQGLTGPHAYSAAQPGLVSRVANLLHCCHPQAAKLEHLGFGFFGAKSTPTYMQVSAHPMTISIFSGTPGNVTLSDRTFLSDSMLTVLPDLTSRTFKQI